MPDQSRVQWSKLKVGLVGTIAFLILAALIFLMTSTHGLFQHNATLYTFMADAGGIADGSAVRLNGIQIGFLDKPVLTTSTDLKKAVRFDMKVPPQYLPQIPVDSVAGITAANVLGDKFINITKGRSSQHVEDQATLTSLQAQDIPELMASMGNLLQSFQVIVNRVDNLLAGVEAGKGNIGKLLKDEELYDRLNGIAMEGQKLVKDIRTGGGTLSKLIYDPDLYNQLQAPLKRVDAMLADLQSGKGTAGKLLYDPALYDEAQRTIVEIRGVVAGINAGRGTAGKLLHDDRLYSQLNELIAKLGSTVDKINSGQGTMGQFLTNPQLYEGLTTATRELQGLVKDMHANPKKFLTIRLTLF